MPKSKTKLAEDGVANTPSSKTSKSLKTVVIKNIGSEYATIVLNGEETILYPNSGLEFVSENPDRVKRYLINKYGNSLTISIK